jgi:hypothetical protein
VINQLSIIRPFWYLLRYDFDNRTHNVALNLKWKLKSCGSLLAFLAELNFFVILYHCAAELECAIIKFML